MAEAVVVVTEVGLVQVGHLPWWGARLPPPGAVVTSCAVTLLLAAALVAVGAGTQASAKQDLARFRKNRLGILTGAALALLIVAYLGVL